MVDCRLSMCLPEMFGGGGGLSSCCLSYAFCRKSFQSVSYVGFFVVKLVILVVWAFDFRCIEAQCRSPIQAEHSLQYQPVAGAKNCMPRIGTRLVGAFEYVGSWSSIMSSCHGVSACLSMVACSFECKWVRNSLAVCGNTVHVLHQYNSGSKNV